MKKESGQKKTRTVGIRVKLIAVIIPIVLVIIITFFGLSRKMITGLAEQNLAANAKVCAGNIYAWTDRIFGELQVYKDTIEEGGFADDEAILAFMLRTDNRVIFTHFFREEDTFNISRMNGSFGTFPVSDVNGCQQGTDTDPCCSQIIHFVDLKAGINFTGAA